MEANPPYCISHPHALAASRSADHRASGSGSGPSESATFQYRKAERAAWYEGYCEDMEEPTSHDFGWSITLVRYIHVETSSLSSKLHLLTSTEVVIYNSVQMSVSSELICWLITFCCDQFRRSCKRTTQLPPIRVIRTRHMRCLVSTLPPRLSYITGKWHVNMVRSTLPWTACPGSTPSHPCLLSTASRRFDSRSSVTCRWHQSWGRMNACRWNTCENSVKFHCGCSFLNLFIVSNYSIESFVKDYPVQIALSFNRIMFMFVTPALFPSTFLTPFLEVKNKTNSSILLIWSLI